MIHDSHLKVAAEEGVTALLRLMDENPDREGLVNTPKRFVKALLELTDGTRVDAASVLGTRFDAETYDEIVVVRAIPFTSVCEHHLLPFTGVVDFAYLPNRHIVGLSKIPRMVRALSQRPQVQERLTVQIAETFQTKVEPRGTAVRVRAQHSCMALRGVRAPGQMVTSVLRGRFKESDAARAEVFSLFGP